MVQTNSVANTNSSTMRKQICVIILMLTCRICDAQNLVPNGDFEQYSLCPDFPANLALALFWFNPSTNVQNVSGTSDYYNACANDFYPMNVPGSFTGYQVPHSDSAYAGILLFEHLGVNYREYIEVQITSTLTSNTCYHFEMYISLGDIGKYTTDDIGIYFSDTVVSNINNYAPLPFIPQINNVTGNYPDTTNWLLVQGDYLATGNENYLIIGNFKDDFSIDTLLYNSQGQNASYIDIVDGSLILTPCTGIEEQNLNSNIKIYPNPLSDILNIKAWGFSEIILYDVAARKLLQQKFTNSTTVNTEQLAKGLYLYEVRNKNGLCKKGKVVKD